MRRHHSVCQSFDFRFVVVIAGSAIALMQSIWPSCATAQNIAQNIQQNAAPTTVQLPSFSQFFYSGSVLVPDGGSASLGGVSRSSSGRSSRGGSAGRAAGSAIAHSGSSVHVTIIDNDAIDRQIRGLDRGQPMGRGQQIGRPSNSAAPDRLNGSSDPDSEGKALVRFARKQYLAGHHTSAFDAYRLAIETLSPSLATLAETEFRRVFPAGTRPVRISVAVADQSSSAGLPDSR